MAAACHNRRRGVLQINSAPGSARREQLHDLLDHEAALVAVAEAAQLQLARPGVPVEGGDVHGLLSRR
jgi:hypothetical protein